MNYDQPRQLEKGGWHYTTFNRRIGTFPIGYCADHKNEPHATEEEARRCYQQYKLNERLKLDLTYGDYNPCDLPECETLTNRGYGLDGWPEGRLCDEHRTKEVVAGLIGELAGDSMHS